MPFTDPDPELRTVTVPRPPPPPPPVQPPPTAPPAAQPHPTQPTAAAPTQVSDAASGGGYGQPVTKVAPVLISDAASSGGYGTRYYTYRAEAERALKPGQKVGFTTGRGYYLYTPTVRPRPPGGADVPSQPTAGSPRPGASPSATPVPGLAPAAAAAGLPASGVPVGAMDFTAAGSRPSSLPLTDPNPADFISATWDQRLTWIATMSQIFGGWFNNIVGIIQYFQHSHYFANDQRMKAADGYVLWEIAEGYRGFLGLGSGNEWTRFMNLQFANPSAPLPALRNLWATAEQDTVVVSTAFSEAKPETDDQAALYDLFVTFGDVYRANVKQNDPAKFLGFYIGADPRKDQGTVRYAAQAVETLYRYAPGLPSWFPGLP